MPLLCLLGRHGSGKSTIGAALQAFGYQHLSVGALRRVAQSNQFPSDVPAGLVSAMRRERPGAPLTPLAARRLVEHANSVGQLVLDGFPSSPDHLALLPPDTVFCVVWTPALLREARLHARAASSKRLWTPGLASAREDALPDLIRQVRRTHRCLFIANAGNVDAATLLLVRKISESRVA